MILLGQPAIGALDRLGIGALGDAQNLVRITHEVLKARKSVKITGQSLAESAIP